MTTLNRPYVSVIINSYMDDPGDYKRVINDYLSQEGVKIQIIISTVVKDKIIKYAKSLKLDIVISQKPGIYRQLNKALKRVKGDWFNYSSANDSIQKDKLIREINYCLGNDKKICYSCFNVEKDGQKTVNQLEDYSYSENLKRNFISDLAVVNSSLINKYAPFKKEFGNWAYWDFWLRIAEEEGNIFIYYPEPTWTYLVSKNSRHIRKLGNKKMWDKDEQDKKNMFLSHGVNYKSIPYKLRYSNRRKKIVNINTVFNP